MVAPAPEEPSRSPGAPGWVADVELYPLLLHRIRALSLPDPLQDRFADDGSQRIAQLRDLLLVQFA